MKSLPYFLFVEVVVSPRKKVFLFYVKAQFVSVPEDELLAWRSGLFFLYELLLEQPPGPADQDTPSECPKTALSEPQSHVKTKLRVLQPSKGS